MNILSLDGGGSKGVYTIGVLKELELTLGVPLHQHFGLIYGTSTGAIIAALIGLGKNMMEIEGLYFEVIPKVMRRRLAGTRSRELSLEASRVFGTAGFDKFLTPVMLVASEYDAARPMIFKSTVEAAHGLKASFNPGFGCSIATAILASTAAYPFFKKQVVETANQGRPTVWDGGFSANNPTLLAIADGINAFKVPQTDLRVLSVGVGHYKEPSKSVFHRLLFSVWPFRMIQKQFATNTNTVEALRRVLFPLVKCVRIDESYTDSEYATDLLESDVTKLRALLALGRTSFGKYENDVATLFSTTSGGATHE